MSLNDTVCLLKVPVSRSRVRIPLVCPLYFRQGQHPTLAKSVHLL
jgi:hypothetical protein